MGNPLASIPVFGGMFDDSADKARAELAKNRDLYTNLQLPDLSWQNYSPEELQRAGQISPEMMQAQTISEDPLTRSAQQSALAKMAGLSESGLTAEDNLAFSRAARTADQEEQRSRLSAIDNARSRGVAGSGLEFALREMGSQSAADRAQEAGLQQAANSAQQRVLYNNAYLQGQGNLRDQDYRASSQNANILNQFNQLNTQARNQAQASNLQNSQTLMNQNTNNRNQAFQYNQTGRNQTAQDNYSNQLKRIDGIAGGNSAIAKGFMAEDAQNTAKRKAAGQAAGTGLGYAYGGPAGASVGGDIGAGVGGGF